jgi:glycosyltransferase involved in cell wall biosynthesis
VGYCIIIPAYNASLTLPAVVAEALQSGAPVLVVDDGSTDATSESVRGLPVNLVIHDRNRGKGAALKSGFSWMLLHGFEGAVTLDADGQHDAGAIILLADTARRDGTDILIASRAVQFSQMAGLRKSWNRFGVWCMRKRTGFDITDSQSGFRYYTSRLIRGVQLDADGYHLEMEILMKGWRGGFRIDSLPVAARVADGRATSHFRPVKDTWNICMTFLRFF